MRTTSLLIALALAGCTKEGAGSESAPIPASPTPDPGARAPTPTSVTVAITAVSLAGDCGEQERDSDRRESSKPACQQTSMQLAVTGAAGDVPIQIRLKRVELFDDKGTRIGELTSRAPTVWSTDGTYRPWDQMVAPSQALSVSYALSEPPWGSVTERWNRTYVLRAVLTIGATDRTVERDVHLAAPAALRPEVET